MRWQGMTHDQWVEQAKIGFVQIAWLPVQLQDGTWVWLEDYYWRLEWTPRGRGWWVGVNYASWPIPTDQPPASPTPRDE